MANIQIILLATLLVLIFFSGLFSSMEMIISRVNIFKLETKLKDKKTWSNKLIIKIVKNFDQILISSLIGNNFSNIFSASVLSLFITYFVIPKELQSTILFISATSLTVFIIIFCEIIPKLFFVNFPEKNLLRLKYFVIFFYIILWPMTKVINIVRNKFSRGDNTYNERELSQVFKGLYKVGKIEKSESILLEKALNFDDHTIEKIYKPIDKLVKIDINSTKKEIMEVFDKTRFSRIPVYSKNPNNIIGVINLKTFIFDYTSRSKTKNLESVNKAYVDDKLNIAFNKMQSTFNHFLFIFDSRLNNKMVGFLTIYDINNYLLGHNLDESDDDMIIESKNGEYTVNGDIKILEILEIFDLTEKVNKNNTKLLEKSLYNYIMEISKLDNLNDEKVFTIFNSIRVFVKEANNKGSKIVFELVKL